MPVVGAIVKPATAMVVLVPAPVIFGVAAVAVAVVPEIEIL